jgi:hypothetical protein
MVYPGQVRQTLKQHTELTQSQVAELSLARILLSVVLVFGLCNLPAMIRAIVFSISNEDFLHASDSGKLEKRLVYTVLRVGHWLLITLNSSLNFIIYCTVSPSFRESLWAVYHAFILGCKRRQPATVSAVSSDSLPMSKMNPNSNNSH